MSLHWLIIFGLIGSPLQAQVRPGNLPELNTLLALTSDFKPAVLKGMSIHPENPLLFDFIISRGQDKLSDLAVRAQGTLLIKYFLAAMTIPDKDVWVNLSPYEKDRIIPDALSQTEMGRQMLEQDYILKQLSASLTDPDKELGKKFWDEVQKRAIAKYGTNEVKTSTYNKVWIVPDGADVYERGGFAYITKSRLKVMMDEDYQSLDRQRAVEIDVGAPATTQDRQRAVEMMASRGTLSISSDIASSVTGAPATTQDRQRAVEMMASISSDVAKRSSVAGGSVREQARQRAVDVMASTSSDVAKRSSGVNSDNRTDEGNKLFSDVFKEIILPKLEKEVNEGKNFASVRQVYQSAILAVWYKRNLKETLLGRVYADRSKVAGVESEEDGMRERVYAQYLEAFKKGVYNVVRETEGPDGDMIPRKYFSGGITGFGNIAMTSVSSSQAMADDAASSDLVVASAATEEQPAARAIVDTSVPEAKIASSVIFQFRDDITLSDLARLDPNKLADMIAPMTEKQVGDFMFRRYLYLASDTKVNMRSMLIKLSNKYNAGLVGSKSPEGTIANDISKINKYAETIQLDLPGILKSLNNTLVGNFRIKSEMTTEEIIALAQQTVGMLDNRYIRYKFKIAGEDSLIKDSLRFAISQSVQKAIDVLRHNPALVISGVLNPSAIHIRVNNASQFESKDLVRVLSVDYFAKRLEVAYALRTTGEFIFGANNTELNDQLQQLVQYYYQSPGLVQFPSYGNNIKAGEMAQDWMRRFNLDGPQDEVIHGVQKLVVQLNPFLLQEAVTQWGGLTQNPQAKHIRDDMSQYSNYLQERLETPGISYVQLLVPAVPDVRNNTEVDKYLKSLKNALDNNILLAYFILKQIGFFDVTLDDAIRPRAGEFLRVKNGADFQLGNPTWSREAIAVLSYAKLFEAFSFDANGVVIDIKSLVDNLERNHGTRFQGVSIDQLMSAARKSNSNFDSMSSLQKIMGAEFLGINSQGDIVAPEKIIDAAIRFLPVLHPIELKKVIDLYGSTTIPDEGNYFQIMAELDDIIRRGHSKKDANLSGQLITELYLRKNTELALRILEANPFLSVHTASSGAVIPVDLTDSKLESLKVFLDKNPDGIEPFFKELARQLQGMSRSSLNGKLSLLLVNPVEVFQAISNLDDSSATIIARFAREIKRQISVAINGWDRDTQQYTDSIRDSLYDIYMAVMRKTYMLNENFQNFYILPAGGSKEQFSLRSKEEGIIGPQIAISIAGKVYTVELSIKAGEVTISNLNVGGVPSKITDLKVINGRNKYEIKFKNGGSVTIQAGYWDGSLVPSIAIINNANFPIGIASFAQANSQRNLELLNIFQAYQLERQIRNANKSTVPAKQWRDYLSPEQILTDLVEKGGISNEGANAKLFTALQRGLRAYLTYDGDYPINARVISGKIHTEGRGTGISRAVTETVVFPLGDNSWKELTLGYNGQVYRFSLENRAGELNLRAAEITDGDNVEGQVSLISPGNGVNPIVNDRLNVVFPLGTLTFLKNKQGQYFLRINPDKLTSTQGLLVISQNLNGAFTTSFAGGEARGVSTGQVVNTSSSPVGGINFDPALLNLQIKRDSHGVPLPQQNFDSINIDGLTPVIIRIQPFNLNAFPVISQGEPAKPVALSKS